MRAALSLDDRAAAERLCTEAEAREAVVAAVRAGRYDEALALLDEPALASAPDPVAFKMRLLIVEAEKRLAELQAELSAAERLVHAFNRAYHARLGVHLAELLKIKQEIYRRWAQKDASRQKQYEEARNDYERLRHAAQDPVPALGPEAESELKEYFKKAVKLCHPDAAPPERVSDAAAAFIALKAAFDRSDLPAVKTIYLRLIQNQYTFHIPSERAKLRLRLESLREKIAALQLKIGAYKSGETYRLASELTDWNAYFAQMQLKIEAEIREHRALKTRMALW